MNFILTFSGKSAILSLLAKFLTFILYQTFMFFIVLNVYNKHYGCYLQEFMRCLLSLYTLSIDTTEKIILNIKCAKKFLPNYSKYLDLFL